MRVERRCLSCEFNFELWFYNLPSINDAVAGNKVVCLEFHLLILFLLLAVP